MAPSRAAVEAFTADLWGPGGADADADAPLSLHLRVRASLPGGVEAVGPQQLRAALDAYRSVVGPGLRFEVRDAVVSTDGTQALVAGEQVIPSRAAAAAAPVAARLLPGTVLEGLAAALPVPAEGRVPTALVLTLGQNDAGACVVTALRVSFHLPSALAPHVRLPAWQRRLRARAGAAASDALQGAGWAAGVAEDAWTAAAAAWRTGGALGAPALEAGAKPLLSALHAAGSAAAAAVKARVWGGKEGGGGGRHAAAVLAH
ncbi:hypothetical protein Rsub_12423 [Raphidocelis subcapitata]|uniref:Uncharacterized protein n=1 Tax=Raphidocelis subcapitata TaxID=307507 RepID=A0A2V0PIT1_9CHLO|nr:hypothetical protein Rsub_12423 [Raphidocelis subcapitata]|eukprot:GBF99711.1 hypothetical protein Rsub_12423 [Raphidocelis subcapitata]